jgi:hypothetical protein
MLTACCDNIRPVGRPHQGLHHQEPTPPICQRSRSHYRQFWLSQELDLRSPP